MKERWEGRKDKGRKEGREEARKEGRKEAGRKEGRKEYKKFNILKVETIKKRGFIKLRKEQDGFNKSKDFWMRKQNK